MHGTDLAPLTVYQSVRIPTTRRARMSGLQHTRDDAQDGPTRQSGAASAAQSPPLGLILFCRRKQKDRGAASEDSGQLSGPERSALADLERRLKSRIYRVYACEPGSTGGWDYFTTLEFGDLRAWNLFEQDLAKNGFGSHFDWDVRAFGRRLS